MLLIHSAAPVLDIPFLPFFFIIILNQSAFSALDFYCIMSINRLAFDGFTEHWTNYNAKKKTKYYEYALLDGLCPIVFVGIYLSTQGRRIYDWCIFVLVVTLSFYFNEMCRVW